VRLRLYIISTIFAWLYAGLLALWLLCHYSYGDTIWWLALINSFAPFLFAPLLIFIPIGLWVRTRAYWVGLALPLATFLLMYGVLFVPKWRVAHAASPTPLTLMTFNIWVGSRLPRTAQVIQQNNFPDIVALQELSPWMMKSIMQEVGQVYPYSLFEIGGKSDGLGVLSRYPITKLSSKHFFALSGQIQVMRVQVGTQTFILYNCHPRSSNVMLYLRYGQSVPDEVEYTFDIRRALIKQLMTDIAERTEPVIVMGDLNSTPQSDVYRLLTRKLADTQRTVGWGFGHTYPAATIIFRDLPLFPRLIRIDMILYTADFIALNSRVSDVHGESDHLPVVAQLAWQQ